MTRTHRRTTDERLYASAQAIFTDGGAPPAVPSADGEQRRMQALLVSFDGAQYVYNGFRYDDLSDALAYATLMQSRPEQFDKSSVLTLPRGFSPPTDAQRTQMATLGIELVGHVYHFAGYHYDQLADAVAYAALSQKPAPHP
jgi:hypothetical protein